MLKGIPGTEGRVATKDRFSLAHAGQLMYNDHASVASLRRVDGMAGTRGRIHRSTHLQEFFASLHELKRQGQVILTSGDRADLA
jgi:hypothetical protein